MKRYTGVDRSRFADRRAAQAYDDRECQRAMLLIAVCMVLIAAMLPWL